MSNSTPLINELNRIKADIITALKEAKDGLSWKQISFLPCFSTTSFLAINCAISDLQDQQIIKEENGKYFFITTLKQ